MKPGEKFTWIKDGWLLSYWPKRIGCHFSLCVTARNINRVLGNGVLDKRRSNFRGNNAITLWMRFKECILRQDTVPRPNPARGSAHKFQLPWFPVRELRAFVDFDAPDKFRKSSVNTRRADPLPQLRDPYSRAAWSGGKERLTALNHRRGGWGSFLESLRRI